MKEGIQRAVEPDEIEARANLEKNIKDSEIYEYYRNKFSNNGREASVANLIVKLFRSLAAVAAAAFTFKIVSPGHLQLCICPWTLEGIWSSFTDIKDTCWTWL